MPSSSDCPISLVGTLGTLGRSARPLSLAVVYEEESITSPQVPGRRFSYASPSPEGKPCGQGFKPLAFTIHTLR